MSASDNLLQSTTRPSWYDLLPLVESAMDEADRVFYARTSAGWEPDEEGGWLAPHPDDPDTLIPYWDWLDLGLTPPEG